MVLTVWWLLVFLKLKVRELLLSLRDDVLLRVLKVKYMNKLNQIVIEGELEGNMFVLEGEEGI